MAAQERSKLVEALAAVPDPGRQYRNLRHRPVDVLVIGFCGVLCGSDDFVEMEEFGRAKGDFFRRFLELPDGIQSHDTFRRVFQAVQRSQGCPAANWSGADDVIFLDADGGVLPFDQWTLHMTGQLLTDDELLHIGPLAAWDRDGGCPVADGQVEALLPDGMRRRLAEARHRGRWPRSSSSSTV
jgi:hypothetical protein